MENVPKLSEMNKKDIPGYIWDYYKWPIIIGLAVIIALFSFIHGRLTAKEEVLYVMAGNCDSIHMVSPVEATMNDFLEDQGYDTKKQMVAVNTNITYTGTGDNVYTLPALTTIIGAQQVDVALTTGELFDFMAGNGEFYPVDELFTEEELEKYGDQLVTSVYHEVTYDENHKEKTTDHEYVCGVKLSKDNAWVVSTNMYPDTEVTASVIFNAPHPELAKAFIIYLLENN